MRKLSFVASLLIILAFVITACSSGKENNEETPGAGTETTGIITGTTTTGVLSGTENTQGGGLPITGGTAAPTEGVTSTETVSATAAITLPAVTTSPVVTATTAVTTTSGITSTTPVTPTTGGSEMTNQTFTPAQLTKLLTYRVRTLNGNDLGSVNDMIVNLGSQRVDFVILASGGFLGMGGKLIPIPWNLLAVGSTGADKTCAFLTNLDKATLTGAPTFDRNKVDLSTSAWETNFMNYWSPFLNQAGAVGASGAGATASSGVTSTGTTSSTNTISGANNNLASTAPGNCAMGKKAGASAASTAAVGASTGTTGSSTVTTTTTLTGTTGSSAAKAGNLSVTMLAKDLLKFNIKDTAGKPVGKIQDAVINTSHNFIGGAGIATSSTITTTNSVTGTTGSAGMMGSANMMGSSQNGGILYLVVELDRSLSNGSKWVLIPLQAFSMGTEKNTFNLVVSSQVLSGAPAFDKNALPDGSISGWDTMIQSYWNQNVH